jgi:hypothetical protein
MAKPVLAFVAGFLAAGKTTLILKAAEWLRSSGKKAAVILNDQDRNLVDTKYARAKDVTAGEIADGCFCCRFSDFVNMAGELAGTGPDVIFAEPVGSCTDLTATVIRPIQDMYADQFVLAPLTVLINPLAPDSANHNVSYLRDNQLAEADLICATHADVSLEPRTLRVPVDFHLSGKTGLGVDAWVNEILHPSRIVGARLLDIDYERYAEAEASLGWLNLHARLDLPEKRSPALVCGPLLEEIDAALSGERIAIAHLKIFDRCATGWVKASISRNGAEPDADGDLLSDASVQHELALNLRALGDPVHLQRIVLAAVHRLCGPAQIGHLQAFRPLPPKPEYRFG